MIRAEKTLAAIESVMDADGGNAFRAGLAKWLPTMDDAYRQGDGGFRTHLGASLIGDECARKLQLGWRWAVKPKFGARLLRLFNRGHLEEARFLSLLEMIPGVELWACKPDGGQFKWSNFGGHFGSALDGIARGIPDLPPGMPCYCEFKTAATKSFKETKEDGVACAHYEHYVQMQQCMKYYQLPAALYMMVNKETDELHAEIVYYDENIADRFTERAKEIIFADYAMPRMNNSPTFFKCKWCDKAAVCHGLDVPEINCRTCCHWMPLEDGSCNCPYKGELSKEQQQAGCPMHVYDPTLLPAFTYLEGNGEENYAVYRDKNGNEFKQGEKHMTSIQFREVYGKK